MAEKKGTIELFLLELSAALQKVADQPMIELLESLGLNLPESIQTDPEFINRVNNLSTPIGQLNDLSTALRQAITDENIPQIILSAKDISDALQQCFSALNEISSFLAASAAALPTAARDSLISFAQAFPRKLVDYCLIAYIESKSRLAAQVLTFLGVLKWKKVEEWAGDGVQIPYTEKKLQFDRIPAIISDPVKSFKELYSWGVDSFDAKDLFSTIKSVIENGVGGIADILMLDDEDILLETYIFSLQRNAAINPPSLDFELSVPFEEPLTISEETELVFPWTQKTELTLQASANVKGNIAPPFKLNFSMPGETLAGDLSVTTATTGLTEPFIIFGLSAGSRLEASGLEIKIGASARSDGGTNKFDSSVGFKLSGLQLIIDLGEADGFMQNAVPVKQLASNFDLSADWSISQGLKFDGSGGLKIAIPTHVEIGPAKLTKVYFNISVSEHIQLETTAAVQLNLGPLTAIIDEIGLKAILSSPSDNSGNLGPFQVDIGFKPPSGIGLTVDSGGIKGGGFLKLDPENGEYFGAMELEFKDMFSMKAYGIINTRLPDGSKGFSLLIVITAEFTPIQLGFGFTLNGVGGLLGLNRTTKVDILKEGIKTNAIKSILFPENVVANIDRIVSDVKQVFPPQKGHFLIAPMAKIGWGTPTIITLEIGLLIEIPSSRLIILGVLKALLPKEEKPLLKMQVNFIGEIDFENKTISFDAVLYDSSLLTFTLSGQMALRIAWNDNPVFVLSVGGFHPAFKEIPKGLERMQRLTIGLINTSDVNITIQTYFAVTSNTVQFGAKAELLATHGSWNIYGFIGYDVLFQFDPFKFIADFSAGVALRRHQSVVMGIQVNGTLAGPSPWDVKGSASISFFFFSISIPFHKSWGDNAGADATEKLDLFQLLSDLITDKRSWSAVIPSNKNLHVSIRNISVEGDKLVIHPFGVLSFSERLLPLGINIDKIGTKLPLNDRHFTITCGDPDLNTDPLTEKFAPANFLKLSDDDKLARPSFESFESGFKITGSESLISPMVVNKSVNYEFSYLGREKKVNKDKYHFEKNIFRKNAGAGIIASSALSYTARRISINAPKKVAVNEERFVVANISNMQLHNAEASAGSFTEAMQYYQQLVNDNPALADKLQVLSAVELN